MCEWGMPLQQVIVHGRHTAGYLVSDVSSNKNKFFDKKIMMLLSKTKESKRGRLFI